MLHSNTRQRPYKYKAIKEPGASIWIMLLLAPHVLGVWIPLIPKTNLLLLPLCLCVCCVYLLGCSRPFLFLAMANSSSEIMFHQDLLLPPKSELPFVTAHNTRRSSSSFSQLPFSSPAPHYRFLSTGTVSFTTIKKFQKHCRYTGA